MQQNKLEN